MLLRAIKGERNNGHSFGKCGVVLQVRRITSTRQCTRLRKEWGGTCTCAGRCTQLLLLVRCGVFMHCKLRPPSRSGAGACRKRRQCRPLHSRVRQAGLHVSAQGGQNESLHVHRLQAKLEAGALQTLIPSMQCSANSSSCTASRPPHMPTSKQQASHSDMQTSRRTRCRRPRRCPAGRSRRSR